MDEKRQRFKSQLETREAEEKSKRARTGPGGFGGQPAARPDSVRPGINVNVLDELRKLGQQQREEAQRKMEESIKVRARG
jgi:hypothetical protein